MGSLIQLMVLQKNRDVIQFKIKRAARLPRNWISHHFNFSKADSLGDRIGLIVFIGKRDIEVIQVWNSIIPSPPQLDIWCFKLKTKLQNAFVSEFRSVKAFKFKTLCEIHIVAGKMANGFEGSF